LSFFFFRLQVTHRKRVRFVSLLPFDRFARVLKLRRRRRCAFELASVRSARSNRHVFRRWRVLLLSRRRRRARLRVVGRRGHVAGARRPSPGGGHTA